MAINLNEFAPNTPLDGMYVYQANLPQFHNVVVSASQGTALKAGDFVKLDTSSTNTYAPVALSAGASDAVFGVLSYNPRKNQWVAGEKFAIARSGDVIFKTAGGAVAVGATLYHTAGNKVVSSDPGSGTTIGIALTPASADGDIIQVLLKL